MKVPMAFCLNCGWVTQDLDELDAHTAKCSREVFKMTPEVARQFSCPCGAREGQRCITKSGRAAPSGSEHMNRWWQAQRVQRWALEHQ